MNEPEFFRILVLGWFALAGVTFVSLFFVEAPYGRYTRGGWGPRVSRRLGWMVMESPSAILMIVFFILGNRHDNLVAIVFLALWEIHYLHRTFIFPFQMRGGTRQITLVPIALAIVFNLGNAYINGRYLFSLAPVYPDEWLADPRFVAGVLLFAVGFFINKQSDHILRHLRQPGETDYKVPHGGVFRLVSCPNYLGEVMEWTGWALATWSLAGLTFAVWTAANLVPRAWAHHRWYRRRFPDYPSNRKAIFPFLF